MNVHNTWNDEKQINSIIGLTKNEADELLLDFSTMLDDKKIGRPAKLTDKELFFMLTFYYRHYPTFEVLSFMFEIDTSNVKRWIDSLEAILRGILSKKNFSHIILAKNEKKLERPLSKNREFILTELNNLYGDRWTK